MTSSFVRDYLSRLQTVLRELDYERTARSIEMIQDAWESGRQIITLGNGGSALTALHYINDWNKSVFLASNRPFRGRCLCENPGLVMAYANDIGYEHVFVEQLKNILEPDDLVIAISGSGNSANVVRAIRYAKEHNARTLAVCGYSGGKLMGLADQAFWVDIDDMQLCEDVHTAFGHMVMQRLCE